MLYLCICALIIKPLLAIAVTFTLPPGAFQKIRLTWPLRPPVLENVPQRRKMFAMLDSKKSCASKFVHVFESGFQSTRAEQFMESCAERQGGLWSVTDGGQTAAGALKGC